MSSSISSSDPGGPAQPARWRGFALAFLATAAVVTFALMALAALIDPYDTGRSPLQLKPGVRPQGPRTAAPSRGRDPAFRAGIFGNSHVQLLSPAILGEKTGIPFVSLISPATGPREALVVMDWFLRHRREPAQALVIGLDDRWCTPDPTLPTEKPFPFWLFSKDPLDYLTGLMRFDVVEESFRRLRYLTARSPERAAANGYWNYEADYEVQGFHNDPALRAKLHQPRDFSGGNSTGPFPAASALLALLNRQASDVPVVLLRTPMFITAQAAPGSEAAKADSACREAYADIARSRPRTALIDWKTDRPENREPENYFDRTHYRANIARLVEADIASALNRLR